MIPTGSTSASAGIELRPVNDRIDEGDGETLKLVATTTSSLTLDPAEPFEITIEDDDEMGMVFSHETLTVREEGSTSYTVKLTAQPTEGARVLFYIDGDAAHSLTLSTDRLDFNEENWDRAQTVRVQANEDPDGDDGSAIIGHWTGARYGSLNVELPITVEDNDLTSLNVELALSPTHVAEDGGPQSVTVEAALDGVARAQDTAVTIHVSGGTASAPADFADIGTVTVTITQGQTRGTQAFNFTPVNDSVDEGLSETVVFTGTAPELAVGTATLTITDDDGPQGDRAVAVNCERHRRSGRKLHRGARDATDRAGDGPGERHGKQRRDRHPELGRVHGVELEHTENGHGGSARRQCGR